MGVNDLQCGFHRIIAPITTDDHLQDGKVGQDVVAVYIGLVLFFGFLFGHMIYQRILFKGTPIFIPLLGCDFETGAVWGRGGGDAMRARTAMEKASSSKPRAWWAWKRFKGATRF